MGSRRNLVGQKLGRWTVKALAPPRGNKLYWMCECDCGVRKEVQGDNLVDGQSQSCGCLRSDVTSQRNLSHGHAKRNGLRREYRAWLNARNRCYLPSTTQYADYGGRGIRMCDEWRENYQSFFRDMGPCPLGCSLDRIDVNGDYEPGNTRWATQAVQARNRRNNRNVNDCRGEDLTLTDCASRLGIPVQALHRLLAKGYEPPEIDMCLNRTGRQVQRNHMQKCVQDMRAENIESGAVNERP
jgi:hypothetical protein